MLSSFQSSTSEALEDEVPAQVKVKLLGVQEVVGGVVSSMVMVCVSSPSFPHSSTANQVLIIS